MADDLGPGGVEDRRLALDDRDQRVAAVTDREEHVTDICAALLAVLGEQRQLSLREHRGRRGHSETVSSGCTSSVVAGQRSGLVWDKSRSRQLREDLGVRLGGVGCLPLDAGAVPGCELGDRIDQAASDPAAARADGHDDRRSIAGPDDDVVGAARTVEVVPRRERALLLLDDQQAFARDDEEALLGVLAVVLARSPGPAGGC